MLIHVVKSGENLNAIASRYGLPAGTLIGVNQLENPGKLVPGQALVIPSASRSHVVLAGETLSGIADKYGVSMASIRQANGLPSEARIVTGQVLTIPARSHTVTQGETLFAISRQYNVPVQTLAEFNGIQNPEQIQTGMQLVIPFPKPVIDVNAYANLEGQPGGSQVQEVGRYLTFSSLFAYRMKPDGTLQMIDDGPFLQASFNTRVVPMMCITNFTAQEAGSALAHTILSSQDLQSKLLDNAIQIMRQKGYRGLNVDFENVRPEDRENYNRFLQLAAPRLHQEGYFLSTALAPKYRADQPGILYEAHDYPVHGRYTDFVVLMTYEWGYRLGPPQAISPLNQIKRVLDYAVTVIPREKIFMGFQIYARDWLVPHQQGQEAETFSQQEALRRAVQHNAEIKYDAAAQSPFFTYTDDQGRGHEVWFEDARSAQAKFQTARDYDLRGISYWTLGFPFPQNWQLLNANFTIRKF